MKNKKGYTIQERIIQELEYADSVENRENKKLLATKVLGAVDMAVEFGLITYKEWEKYIEKIFKMA